MKYPIFIGEGLYSLVPYLSLLEIQYYLEPWYADEDDVVVYDCEGQLLELVCDNFSYQRTGFFGKEITETVKELNIKEPAITSIAQEDLVDSLSYSLENIYIEDPKLTAYFNQASLPMLVNAMINRRRLTTKDWPQAVRQAAFCYPLTIQVADAYQQSFETLKAAEASLCYRLAQDGLYSGFDGAGRRLVVEPYKKNRIVISLIEGIAMEPVSDGKK